MPLSRIAYVDDDRAMRDLVELALAGDAHLHVDTFDCGYDALRALPACRPDLILLDVVMPLMGGVELFYRLRDEPDLRGVPVVFLTGMASAHELRQLGELAPVLRKPVDPDTLGAALEAIHAAGSDPAASEPIPFARRAGRARDDPPTR